MTHGSKLIVSTDPFSDLSNTANIRFQYIIIYDSMQEINIYQGDYLYCEIISGPKLVVPTG